MEENKEISIREKRIRNLVNIYYSRADVQKAMFNFSRNREISPRYFEGFGKRPDSFEYPGDIVAFVKKGATSFHCSEELWKAPLDIKTGMSEQEANDIRMGWDLLLDIDSKYIDYSKIMANELINVLKFHGVKNVGVKFSVSGDTPILIKNKEEISLAEIYHAINLLKKGEELEVLSLDKNRKLKFSKVYGFLEHKDILYEIKHTQSTIPIKATSHHSVFVWNNGEIVQKKVDELNKGDFLISFNSSENPLVKDNLIAVNEFSFSKNQYSKKNIIKRVKVNSELMRLIGYFLAEGHITNIINQVGFTFNKNEIEYIEDVKNLLRLITKKNISIRHPNPNSTQILIHSKEWASFFDKFCGKKKNKHVPNFSWNLSEELFLEMLKGYICGDGYKIGEYGIVVKSVSKRLIIEMIWLCKLNNISCNLSKEQGKPHRSPQGNMFKGSLVYLFHIPKSELEKLEFHRERNKFSPYAGDRVFPVDGLKKVYKQIKPKLFNYHRQEQMTLKKKRANLKRIKKVLDWFEETKEKDYDENSKIIINNYRELFDSDISVVEIKEVIPKGEEMVYDVSVEETEAFFGNYYPVLLHNSGSKGFHLIVPWKAFPKVVNGVKTSNMFPEWPRIILRYIDFRTRNRVTEKINQLSYKSSKYDFVKKYIRREGGILNLFDKSSSENLEQHTEDLKKSDVVVNKEVIPDLVLVSPRHLFRMPYSLHEKTSLSSVVIDKDKVDKFELRDADAMKVKVRNFYPKAEEGEARELLIAALDWWGQKDKGIEEKTKEYKTIKIDKLSEKNFPPCVQNILKGLVDGKKRGVFVLINLFRNVGMDRDELEKRIYDWNKKNKPPLKEGYIKSQLIWSYGRKQILPSNCKEFYQGIGVCAPDGFCGKIKNPVNYVVRKSFIDENRGKWKKEKVDGVKGKGKEKIGKEKDVDKTQK